MKKTALFSTACFPSLSYFVLLVKFGEVYWDEQECYQKQSYRNRYEILTPAGKQSLSIPVQKISGTKQAVKDVRIDYKNDWQLQHLKTLRNAYLSSPFFVHYIDALAPFFTRPFRFLFDYNLQIMYTLLEEIGLNESVRIISEPCPVTSALSDYRSAIHPKKESVLSRQCLPEYTQVFSPKQAFVSDLSILDLLFNEGPNTENLLKKSVRKPNSQFTIKKVHN
ncbi:MAG: hypothetical protein CSB06_00210 [Bacteroidia bacterium]|nr:MAG: hypothetical protein CSB06_00210 [Bacteroidia bacterium]